MISTFKNIKNLTKLLVSNNIGLNLGSDFGLPIDFTDFNSKKPDINSGREKIKTFMDIIKDNWKSTNKSEKINSVFSDYTEDISYDSKNERKELSWNIDKLNQLNKDIANAVLNWINESSFDNNDFVWNNNVKIVNWKVYLTWNYILPDWTSWTDLASFFTIPQAIGIDDKWNPIFSNKENLDKLYKGWMNDWVNNRLKSWNDKLIDNMKDAYDSDNWSIISDKKNNDKKNDKNNSTTDNLIWNPKLLKEKIIFEKSWYDVEINNWKLDLTYSAFNLTENKATINIVWNTVNIQSTTLDHFDIIWTAFQNKNITFNTWKKLYVLKWWKIWSIDTKWDLDFNSFPKWLKKIIIPEGNEIGVAEVQSHMVNKVLPKWYVLKKIVTWLWDYIVVKQ